LLIVAALDNQELAKFIQVADEIGLDALVEVHDEMELERALDVGACMIGVNQRDLHTFEVDGNRAGRLACRMDVSITKVAESGISTAEDVSHLAEVGYDAVLIGESLVTSLVPSELLSQMVKAGLPRGARL
ncbi:MAG TPA: indole-3-glycerol-phosphate synthase TrpC, partial [Acidimicrobiales bacterium]|nr:indole-3-glycerol-phosphate synthase TrpC [Acidimicrobiales bacterium]